MPIFLSRNYILAAPAGSSDLAVPFSFINRDHVKVYSKLPSEEDWSAFTAFTWAHDGLLDLDTDTAEIMDFWVNRETPDNDLLAEQQSGNVVSSNINLVVRQLLFLSQETQDQRVYLEDNILSRAVMVPPPETADTLKPANERANTIAGWDSQGDWKYRNVEVFDDPTQAAPFSLIGVPSGQGNLGDMGFPFMPMDASVRESIAALANELVVRTQVVDAPFSDTFDPPDGELQNRDHWQVLLRDDGGPAAGFADHLTVSNGAVGGDSADFPAIAFGGRDAGSGDSLMEVVRDNVGPNSKGCEVVSFTYRTAADGSSICLRTANTRNLNSGEYQGNHRIFKSVGSAQSGGNIVTAFAYRFDGDPVQYLKEREGGIDYVTAYIGGKPMSSPIDLQDQSIPPTNWNGFDNSVESEGISEYTNANVTSEGAIMVFGAGKTAHIQPNGSATFKVSGKYWGGRPSRLFYSIHPCSDGARKDAAMAGHDNNPVPGLVIETDGTFSADITLSATEVADLLATGGGFKVVVFYRNLNQEDASLPTYARSESRVIQLGLNLLATGQSNVPPWASADQRPGITQAEQPKTYRFEVNLTQPTHNRHVYPGNSDTGLAVLGSLWAGRATNEGVSLIASSTGNTLLSERGPGTDRYAAEREAISYNMSQHGLILEVGGTSEAIQSGLTPAEIAGQWRTDLLAKYQAGLVQENPGMRVVLFPLARFIAASSQIANFQALRQEAWKLSLEYPNLFFYGPDMIDAHLQGDGIHLSDEGALQMVERLDNYLALYRGLTTDDLLGPRMTAVVKETPDAVRVTFDKLAFDSMEISNPGAGSSFGGGISFASNANRDTVYFPTSAVISDPTGTPSVLFGFASGQLPSSVAVFAGWGAGEQATSHSLIVGVKAGRRDVSVRPYLQGAEATDHLIAS